jgi:hypothetical protein
MTTNGNGNGMGLATIQTDGHVPECRMHSAQQVQDYVRRLVDNDVQRSQKRQWVNGLVDGNPPYRQSKLRGIGRADATNANFGVPRAYMESGSGAFYDLTSEAPGFFGVKTSFGTDEEREYYNSVMREESDRVLSSDDVFDYDLQQSQWDMTLHGCGPLMFEDGHKVLPKAFHCGDLKVPEFTKSDTHYWEACCVLGNYYPPEVFDWIRKPDVAETLGWDVAFTKKVIENAMGLKRQNGIMPDWEFYQDELKTNSLSYSNDENKMCRLSHVFWREFDGRITHAIVEQDTTTTGNSACEFLYKKVGRYASWKEVIHPMYYDRGNRGYHHSVTGLGIKMGKPLDYQNKMLCNLTDKAFSPKILFKPTTTESAQKFQLAHFGDYAVMPGGFEWAQTGVAGLLNDGLAMNSTIAELMQQNLSGYRQGPMKQQGNPVTARQVMFDASQQANLSKTTYARYYKQLDLLYAEIMRRLCNLNSTDKRAQEFQERCEDRGVPRECFGRIEKVEAIRVIGQGSAFMRREAIQSIGAVSQALPEEGRDLWLTDFISAQAGQSAAARYNPVKFRKKMPSEQEAEAVQWVGIMRTGTRPIATSSQNPVIYATIWLQAAAQEFSGLEQGANPMDVLQFVTTAGPAIATQLARFAHDPSRAEIFQELSAQFKLLAQNTDKLQQQIQQQQEQQQAQQQKTQQAMSDDQLAEADLQSDIRRKDIKVGAQLQQGAQKHDQKMQQGRQAMILKDAMTATDIRLKRLESLSSTNGEAE